MAGDFEFTLPEMHLFDVHTQPAILVNHGMLSGRGLLCDSMLQLNCHRYERHEQICAGVEGFLVPLRVEEVRWLAGKFRQDDQKIGNFSKLDKSSAVDLATHFM